MRQRRGIFDASHGREESFHNYLVLAQRLRLKIWIMVGASAAELFLFAFFCLPFTIRSESFAGFDAASASSVYSAGFWADQALKARSGYWCR